MKGLILQVYVPENMTVDIIDGDPGSHVVNRERLIELLTTASDVSLYLEDEKGTRDRANGIAERDYSATVDGIVSDLREQIRDGHVTDRDSALEWITETVDGHHDVIYTHAAMEVVRVSRNDDAYFAEGLYNSDDFKDGIDWSKLAYCALERDVHEAIGDLDEWFVCCECGGAVDEDDQKATEGDNLPTCADCRNDDDDEDASE